MAQTVAERCALVQAQHEIQCRSTTCMCLSPPPLGSQGGVENCRSREKAQSDASPWKTMQPRLALCDTTQPMSQYAKAQEGRAKERKCRTLPTKKDLKTAASGATQPRQRHHNERPTGALVQGLTWTRSS